MATSNFNMELKQLGRFRGLDQSLLPAFVATVSTLMMVCASVWMVSLLLTPVVGLVPTTAPYYLLHGTLFIGLFLGRHRLQPIVLGTLLSMLLFGLSVLLSVDIPTVGGGVVPIATATAIMLLIRGTWPAAMATILALILRLVVHVNLDKPINDEIYSSILSLLAAVILGIGVHALASMIEQYQIQKIEARQRLSQLKSDRTELLSLLARDIQAPTDELRELMGQNIAQAANKRLMNQTAAKLLQIIDGLEAVLSVRDMPQSAVQDTDLHVMIDEARHQGQQLLQPRGIRVTLGEVDLPVRHYLADKARLHAMLVSAAHVMYMLDDNFTELEISARGHRISDERHAIEFTFAVDSTRFSLKQLERAMSGKTSPRTSDELTLQNFFGDVQSLTAELGGKIKLAPNYEGKTMAMLVTLELEPAPLVSSRQSRSIGNTTIKLMGGRILLVDDDDIQRRAAKLFLEKNFSATVVGASSGDEAVKICRGDRAFDLMITDYLMPGKNGAEVIRELHAAGYPVPLIALTAVKEHHAQAELKNAGAAAVIIKPLTVEGLQLAIESIAA